MERRDNNIFGYEQVAKRIANIRLTPFIVFCFRVLFDDVILSFCARERNIFFIQIFHFVFMRFSRFVTLFTSFY